MAVITTGKTFANGEQLSAAKLNQVISGASFNISDAVDGSTMTLIGGAMAVNTIAAGQIGTDAVETVKIKDANVTKAKIENVADYKVLGNVSGGAAAPSEVAILDEDTMSSDSAISLATQQSIKAYVDANSGTVLQRTRVSSTAQSQPTTVIPADNTTPLSSEGTQILSTSFTPTSTSNKIEVKFNGLLAHTSAGGILVLALFEGSTCKGAKWMKQMSNGTGISSIEFEFTPSSTDAATYSLRYGPTAGTANVNRDSASTFTLGGLSEISMTVTEVKP